MHSENKLKTINPINNRRANSTFEPLVPPHRALKITLNTKVKISSIKIGVINDQKIPINEPRYLPNISRLVEANINSRFRYILEKIVNIDFEYVSIINLLQRRKKIVHSDLSVTK